MSIYNVNGEQRTGESQNVNGEHVVSVLVVFLTGKTH